LSHVDRIGFYERQTCLVLDAVTVRNLELIKPLPELTPESLFPFH
jgi:DNA mismatch repair protein MutS